MSRRRLTVALAGALLGALALAAPAGASSTNFNPNDFSQSTTIDNPWLPFPAGTTIHFTGVVDHKSSTDTESVTNNTPTIDGVKARAVHEEVAVNNKVIEKTDDFYAQDNQGNVWYMGEDSFELQNGKFVLASDSWKAGVNGARPGIIQEANPKVGDSYKEEDAPGVAEDQAKVLSLNESVTVPYGSFNNVLETVRRPRSIPSRRTSGTPRGSVSSRRPWPTAASTTSSSRSPTDRITPTGRGATRLAQMGVDLAWARRDNRSSRPKAERRTTGQTDRVATGESSPDLGRVPGRLGRVGPAARDAGRPVVPAGAGLG
jgi:hypothetical protein